MLYNTLILSHLNYGLTAWGYRCDRIRTLQKKAVRIICLSKYNAHTDPLFKSLNLLKVEHILKLQELKLYHKFSTCKTYHLIKTIVFTTLIHLVSIIYIQPGYTTNLPHTINNAPDLLKDKITTHSLHGFSNYIKHYYLNTYIEQCAIQNCYICQYD